MTALDGFEARGHEWGEDWARFARGVGKNYKALWTKASPHLFSYLHVQMRFLVWVISPLPDASSARIHRNVGSLPAECLADMLAPALKLK